VLEAMKMEHAIQADRDGRVAKIHVEQGVRVAGGALLIEIEAA
jgi:3-methylcrotonyl-CoA carboxylase alpha subunit